MSSSLLATVTNEMMAGLRDTTYEPSAEQWHKRNRDLGLYDIDGV